MFVQGYRVRPWLKTGPNLSTSYSNRGALLKWLTSLIQTWHLPWETLSFQLWRLDFQRNGYFLISWSLIGTTLGIYLGLAWVLKWRPLWALSVGVFKVLITEMGVAHDCKHQRSGHCLGTPADFGVFLVRSPCSGPCSWAGWTWKHFH